MLMEATAATSANIASVLEVLGAVFTYLVSKIGDLCEIVMAQPLLLIPIGISVAYVVVRFFKYIFSLVR
jgi:hypothetical protein